MGLAVPGRAGGGRRDADGAGDGWTLPSAPLRCSAPVNRRGATTVEYALLLSLFVLVLIAALYTVSGAVSDMWVAIEAGFGG